MGSDKPSSTSFYNQFSLGIFRDMFGSRQLLWTVFSVTANMLLTLAIWIGVYDMKTNSEISRMYFLESSSQYTTGNDVYDGILNGLGTILVIGIVSFVMLAFALLDFRRIVKLWLTISCCLILFGVSGTTAYDLISKFIDVSTPNGQIFGTLLVGAISLIYGSVGLVAFFSNSSLWLHQFYVVTNCSLIAVFYLRVFPGVTTWFVLWIVVFWDIFAVLSPIGPLRKVQEKAADYSNNVLRLLMFTADEKREYAGADRNNNDTEEDGEEKEESKCLKTNVKRLIEGFNKKGQQDSEFVQKIRQRRRAINPDSDLANSPDNGNDEENKVPLENVNNEQNNENKEGQENNEEEKNTEDKDGPAEKVEEKEVPEDKMDEKDSQAEKVEKKEEPAEKSEEDDAPAENTEQEGTPIEKNAGPEENAIVEEVPVEKIEDKKAPIEMAEQNEVLAGNSENDDVPAKAAEENEAVVEKAEPAEKEEEKELPVKENDKKDEPTEKAEEEVSAKKVEQKEESVEKTEVVESVDKVQVEESVEKTEEKEVPVEKAEDIVEPTKKDEEKIEPTVKAEGEVSMDKAEEKLEPIETAKEEESAEKAQVEEAAAEKAEEKNGSENETEKKEETSGKSEYSSASSDILADDADTCEEIDETDEELCAPRTAADALNDGESVRLGFGDFVFYSLLVGQAAAGGSIYATAAAGFGVIFGLLVTLTALSSSDRTTPALPMSVILGTLAYAQVKAFEKFWMYTVYGTDI